MIIRSHKMRERNRFADKPRSSQLRQVWAMDAFQREIAKEISRSNRREIGRDFSVLQIHSIHQQATDVQLSAIVEHILKRIRISDTVGWLNGRLAVLLPETNHQSAMLVAEEISRASQETSAMKIEISVYPDDDEIALLADDFFDVKSTYSLNPQPRSQGDNQLDRDSSGFADLEFSQQLINANPADNGPTAALCSPLPAIDEWTISGTVAGTAQPPKIRYANQQNSPNTAITLSKPTPWWKRAVDIVGASAGLLVLSPVLFLAALLVRLTSTGPIFFSQKREGKDGRIFDILKFRTMVTNAEELQSHLRASNEQDGPAFKLKHDPRITTIGHFLRKSCVDELPQLINILRGEMSLVGPRPLPIHESFACKPWQRVRLSVLPGLTCIWQIRGKRKVQFDEWMRMDLDYIQKQSFWFDLKLICQTALLVLLQRGSA